MSDTPADTTPAGFTHLHRGKVRDLYRDPAGRLVMVASDRISAFDHVLEPGIPDKGRILTAMSTWWFEQLDIANHVLAVDDPALPPQWRGRATVCTELEMIPIEAVARGYLAGSGTVEYRESGTVCGIALPAGLEEGSRLPEPIFTPATKAAIGEHDENIDFDTAVGIVGAGTAQEVRRLTLKAYSTAATLAAARGIILADTKLEFGRDPSGALVLADEVLTPDSSRFWPADLWEPGHAQPSFDKQFVRDWLLSPESGWDRAGDEPPPPLPEHVITATRHRYIEAYERLTGNDFADWMR